MSKQVLLTGASGFLGGYISQEFGDELITLGRGKSNQIQIDLASEIPKLPSLSKVIHAAGFAHRVPKSEIEKNQFFKVNVQGTKNLLLGIAAMPEKPEDFIFISTVAVYGLDQGTGISEENIPQSTTPYGQSKWEAERLIADFCAEWNISLTILRLPLVAGVVKVQGNLKAMIHAIRKGFYFRIKGVNPQKSMVLASDVAKLIAEIKDRPGVYNLTDGINPSLVELEEYLANYFSSNIKTLPIQPIKWAAKFGDWMTKFPLNTYRLEKLKSSLTFDDSKAVRELNWKPNPVIGNLDLERLEK